MALTEAQLEPLYDALFAAVDGDYLIGGDRRGEDVAYHDARVSDIVRWAVNAVQPVVTQMIDEAVAKTRAERYEHPDWAALLAVKHELKNSRDGHEITQGMLHVAMKRLVYLEAQAELWASSAPLRDGGAIRDAIERANDA